MSLIDSRFTLLSKLFMVLICLGMADHEASAEHSSEVGLLLTNSEVTTSENNFRAAFQDTLTVPEGDVTALIDAIKTANDAPEDSAVIQISGIYTLSPVAHDSIPFQHEGNTGLPAIESNITIESSGEEKATIQRDSSLTCELDFTTSNEKFRLFYITENAMLTLQNLYVSNGCIDDSSFSNRFAGGILNAGGELNINESNISNHVAIQLGGGIHNNNNGELNITNSSIVDNSAEGEGGAIYLETGTSIITESLITNNSSDVDGGGIFNLKGNIEILHSTFSTNSSENYGGGIHNDGEGVVEILESDFIANTAERGAGIRNRGEMYINNSTVSGNSANNQGAGIRNIGLMNIDNSQITDNTADERGGGIYTIGDSLNISDSEISNNNSGTDGGGVFNRGNLSIHRTDIFSNKSTENGGGISNEANIEIIDSEVCENTSEGDGGGMHNGSSAILDESIIRDNNSDLHGGGIFNLGEVYINDSEIFNNTAPGDGGGIKNGGRIPDFSSTTSGMLEINNSKISQNTATDGGGIHSEHEESTILLMESTINNNTADKFGGGIYNDEGKAELSHVNVAENSSTNNQGGGILNWGIITINNSEILANSADREGGGISILGGHVSISFGDISDNNTGIDGGGIFNNSSDSLIIVDSKISGNVADQDGGGILNANNSNLEIRRSIISDNNASGFGGGTVNRGVMLLEFSTIAFNESGAGGGIDNVSELNIFNSTIFENSVNGNGGGILNISGESSIAFSTILANSAAGNGGGISVEQNASVSIKNSIVSGSLSGGDCNIGNEFIAEGDNLSSDASCLGFSYSETDPQFDPRGTQDHGGPTPVIALQAGSPAIDAADDCTDLNGNPIETDQRGVKRPQGSACDLGAFESGFEPGELTIHPGQAGNNGAVTVTVYGSGLSENHTVRLVHEDHPDIEGQTASASEDSTQMEVRFDLVDQPTGTRNVEIISPTGFSQTLEEAFTIIEGEDPEVWAEIQGADRILGGETATVNINYGNRGETDVHDVLLYIHLPDDLEFSVNENDIVVPEAEDIINVDELTAEEQEELEKLEYYTDVAGEDRTVIPLWYYRLPAQSSETIRMEIQPDSTNTQTKLSRAIQVEIGAVSVSNHFSRTGDYDQGPPTLLDIFAFSIFEAAEEQQEKRADTNPIQGSSTYSNSSLSSNERPCDPYEQLEDRLEDLQQTREDFVKTARDLTPGMDDAAEGWGVGYAAGATCLAGPVACGLATVAAGAYDLANIYDTFEGVEVEKSNPSAKAFYSNSVANEHPCLNSDDNEHDPSVSAGVNTSSRSFGHPHFMTFDRKDYDFQAVGEFILTRSTMNETEVQIRLERFNTDYEDYTIITAAAMNVAGDKVVFLENRETVENVPDLQINGTSTDLPEMGDGPVTLSNGGIINRAGRTFMVEWPEEGTRVDVRQSATVMGMVVEPMLAPKYSGQLEGLLGNADGNKETDFTMRDGTVLIQPLSFEELYRDFGDSWRITNEESLFGTPTFENLDIPTQHVTTEDLDPEAVDEAEQICAEKGVEDPILMNNCVFDVAITGDERFADDTIELITPKADEQVDEWMDDTDSKIQVILDAAPGRGQEFSFSGSGEMGDFMLTEDGNDSTRTHTKAFPYLSSGTYEISQQLPEDDWQLSNITCNEQEGVTISADESMVTIDLTEGEIIRCTFKNIGSPSPITLIGPEPEQTIEADSIQFTWEPGVPEVQEYEFELASDESFTDMQHDTTITDTSLVVEELAGESSYWWRVRAGNEVGWGEYSEPANFTYIYTGTDPSGDIPEKYDLGQNYPNPFNPKTEIEFALPEAVEVELTIYDITGRRVATLVDEQLQAGNHQVTFDASNLASGVYIYRIQAGSFADTKKLTLIK